MQVTKAMDAATPPRGDEARILDKIFDEVSKVRVPAGADRLDLGLDIDARDGVPAVHLKLSLHAEVLGGGTSARFVEPPPEVAFGPRGHGTIVLVAVSDLELRRPDIKAKIEEILATDPQGGLDFFGAANWADHIKRERPETKPWHFVDLVYDPRDPDAAPQLPAPPHAISQLAALSRRLRETRDETERREALSFVLHIVGDVHQPLHCVTRVTPDHPAPEGDRGGNLFLLSGHHKNLHSLWDDSVNLQLPDSAEDLAVEIVKRHPRARLAREIAVRDPEAWVRAGYALAIEKGYRPLEGDEDARPSPSPAYLRAALHVGQRQAALGGYRLADLLIDVLDG